MAKADETSKGSKRGRSLWVIVFAVLGAVLVAAAVALAAFNVNYSKTAGERAQAALDQVEAALPPVPLDDYRAPSGNLPAVQAEGRSFAGVVDLPTLDVRLPVQSSWPDDGPDFSPALWSYDVATGRAVVGGANYASHFGRVSELRAGDEVYFTDMSAVRHAYQVVVVAAVAADDDAALRETCGDWDLSLFANTYSGLQRTVVCCSEKPAEDRL